MLNIRYFLFLSSFVKCCIVITNLVENFRRSSHLFPLHVHYTVKVFPVGFTIAALKSNEGQCLVSIGLADWTTNDRKFVSMMYLEHVSAA